MPDEEIGTSSRFDFESFWWEPVEGKEPRPAQGHLSYTPTEGAILSIVDLHPEVDPMEDVGSEIPVLHGHTLAGNPCTLLDLTFKHRDGQLFGGHSYEEWHSNLLIYGEHVGAPDQLQFSRARFCVSGLREWLWQHWGENQSVFVRTGEGVLEVPLEGATMTFQREERKHHGQFESWEKFRAWARFDFDLPVTLSEFKERYSQPLHDLVLFAIHEEIRVEAMTILIPEELEKWWGDKKPIERVREVEVVQRTNSQPLRPRKHRYEHGLVPLTAWGDDAPERIRQWFDLRRKLGGLADLLFATLNVRYIYLENQVLNLMAFAEGYHRALHDELVVKQEDHEDNVEEMLVALEGDELRKIYAPRLEHAHEQSQRRRLRHLVDRAGEVLEEAKPWRKDLVDALIDTRNYFIHWGDKGDSVLEGQQLARALRRLQVVIEINLLLDIETSEKVVEEAIRHCYAGRGVLLAD